LRDKIELGDELIKILVNSFVEMCQEVPRAKTAREQFLRPVARTRQQSPPQQTRDRKKALIKRKKPVRVYQRPDVGLKEIKRKGSDLVPRSAK
jgi:hypothetical protein